LLHLGGFGLLILGVLDSSFLVMPLGNDLLLIVLTARRHTMLFYYAAMATAGSVMGCLIMDLISRRGGEKGLKSTIGDKRTEYVKKKVKRYGGWALAVSALMPPPFPFTPFVAGAAAFQFPRKKLLSVIAVSRFVRFSIDGSLAVLFGTRILKWVQAPEVVYGIIFIVVVSIVASVISIYGWIQRSRSVAGRSRRGRQPAHAR
jgi:membrane protein YqaA with SNARE-associated domain